MTQFSFCQHCSILCFSENKLLKPYCLWWCMGGGCACAHVDKCTRHMGGNGVEERALIRNQTPPPKEGANAISCLLCYLSPPQPLPPSAGLVVCIRIPWDVCKNMRVPRLNPSLIGPGSLEAVTRNLILAEPWPDVTRQRWCTFHLWMSPLILSPGQRPRHANRVSKILNREYHQTEPRIFLTIKLKFRKETNMPQASGNHCWSPGQAGDNACLL